MMYKHENQQKPVSTGIKKNNIRYSIWIALFTISDLEIVTMLQPNSSLRMQISCL